MSDEIASPRSTLRGFADGIRNEGEHMHAVADLQLLAVDAMTDAIREAIPYVYNVACDPANKGWRSETAEEVLARMKAAIGEL